MIWIQMPGLPGYEISRDGEIRPDVPGGEFVYIDGMMYSRERIMQEVFGGWRIIPGHEKYEIDRGGRIRHGNRQVREKVIGWYVIEDDLIDRYMTVKEVWGGM